MVTAYLVTICQTLFKVELRHSFLHLILLRDVEILYKMVHSCLVGGFNPSEKYYIVNWDDYSQYMEK